MEQFRATETLIIELLLVVSLVATAVRRLRVPYTVALVLAGLLITFNSPLQFDLTPELILAIFVPPLVFEAAFHLELARLRDTLAPILVLAIPGVVLTALIVAAVVRFGLGLPLATGLVFGALISATDPVAVVALFRTVGVPRRLAVMVEGESLFNDGTAIVVFNLVVAAALAAGGPGGADPLAAAVGFLRVSVGGLAVGGALGWVTALLIARIDDYLIETTLTTALAFGAYLVGERAGVSGVLAVVAAGVICGNVGPRGMSPTTRIVLYSFWEYVAFVANSLVFLLIGLDVNIPQLLANLVPIGVAILAVVLSRAVVVYGLAWLADRRGAVPRPYRHVLFWGGLRGAIGLALALSLPASFADRELLRAMAVGVVLFTLLVQGTTMGWLLRRLGLVGREPAELEYERRHGRLMALRAARERVAQLHRAGMISAVSWAQVAPQLDARVEAAVEAQRALLDEHPGLRDEEIDDAVREGLRAERVALGELLAHGVISEQVYAELLADVDAGLQSDPATLQARLAGPQEPDGSEPRPAE